MTSDPTGQPGDPINEKQCTLDPDCTWPEHDASDHPCGQPHVPGAPCAYCGKPTPLDGKPCPACWITLDGMPLADIKPIFAADGAFNIGGAS